MVGLSSLLIVAQRERWRSFSFSSLISRTRRAAVLRFSRGTMSMYPATLSHDVTLLNEQSCLMDQTLLRDALIQAVWPYRQPEHAMLAMTASSGESP